MKANKKRKDETMKHIFRKNQVIITALAIMIAVAGYLNFTQDKSNVAVNTAAKEDEITYGDLDDSTLDLSEEDIDTASKESDEKKDAKETNGDKVEVSDTGELIADASEKSADAGEAVLVNNTIGSDFFSSARLTREQTRAKNKEMLMEIVDNKNVTEQQKKDAVKGIVKLTSIAEMESATEILLEAKGFKNAVVSIVDNSADVIVNAKDLTEQQIAQIEDIVKRKTEISAENIVISPVGVQEKE
ncbi:SpoIIIAH-like family protein [Velocimicrobium porci]|nr:SpoIIIAH-like family protein [Velocimicrobium porci]